MGTYPGVCDMCMLPEEQAHVSPELSDRGDFVQLIITYRPGEQPAALLARDTLTPQLCVPFYHPGIAKQRWDGQLCDIQRYA